jgi:hypothetical protein
MNREMEEENRILKAALEAATKGIESKMEKIAQLENLETVGRSCHFLPELIEEVTSSHSELCSDRSWTVCIHLPEHSLKHSNDMSMLIKEGTNREH